MINLFGGGVLPSLLILFFLQENQKMPTIRHIYFAPFSSGPPVIIIIIHEFHGDTSLKQNFRAAIIVTY